MSEMPRKLRIQSDNGITFFGDPEAVDNLPNEYQQQINAQLARLSEGKDAEPVRVPAAVLGKAGFQTQEELDAEIEQRPRVRIRAQQRRALPPPLPETPDVEPQQESNAVQYAPQQSESNASPFVCDKCPLREVAMKVIAKTLERL